MKKYLSIIFAALLMASCVDTDILPDSKTVDEDFWQSKSDVQLMVNGAYARMLNADLIMRLIVWGDFRSDELLMENSLTNATAQDLEEIENVNIQTDNMFNNWASLYSVINYCNIVLEKATPVMLIDPSYTEGDYLTDRSQMLALRSLCYFYLVRNFRDVPMTEGAYMNSSQPMDIPQVAPDSVLSRCIEDLVEAEQNALDPQAYRDWRRTGWINRDAIDAMLADIYLWRASVKHDSTDYQKCVEYCEKVIASKQAQHTADLMTGDDSEYPLATYDRAFRNIFITQNAEESIFELVFDGSNNSNTSYCQAFYKYNNNNSSMGYMKVASPFSQTPGGSASVYLNSEDFRYWENICDYKNVGDASTVRKGITETLWIPNKSSIASRPDRAYDRFGQDYIIYRLTDVMLMEAEALVQLAAADGDETIRKAFDLMSAVQRRSYETKASAQTWGNSGYSIANMETMVLAERLRELCFEGKRWYDLLRYNYRHVSGVDYSTTLFEQAEAGVPFVNNFDEMLTLLVRKYESGGSSYRAKMRTEPYLYMPVLQSQIEVSPALRQNPVYSSNSQFEKQY